MSQFLDTFKGEQVGWQNGRPLWMTLTSLRYESALLGDRVIVVPAEFITDGASVPRLPLVWLIAGGRGTRAAVIHDWNYQRGYDRELADALFYESLRADPIGGANALQAWEMWLAVRAGGGSAWANYRKRAATLNPEWTRDGWPTW